MPNNEFKPFAGSNTANVTSQADYETLPALQTGFTSGKASSAQVNKALRQSSFIAAAIAQFVAEQTHKDVLDDGNLSALKNQIEIAIENYTKTILPLSSAINSTSETTAATSKAIKTAYDLAASKLSKSANLSDVVSVADVLTNLGLNETVEKADISLSRARNLSDLNDIPQSRISLGLKGGALLDVGTSAEVAAGTVSKLVSIPALMAFFDLAATAINGSIRIPDRPGGIIFAWGTAPAGGSGTFTVAFNNPPFVMPQVASGQGSGAWDPVHVVVQSTSNTGFSTYNQSLARKYIAIGK